MSASAVPASDSDNAHNAPSAPRAHDAPSAQEQVCPACGQYVDFLDDNSGWCVDCTPVLKIVVSSLSKSTLVQTQAPSTAISSTEQALARNVQAIEHYISQPLDETTTTRPSVWRALRLAQADRPRCIVCGDPIKRANRKSIFCRNTPQCRRYSRRYIYLYQEKHLSKPEALAQIMGELNA